jgi:inosine-uridine nucleoside N-ribohydrolase
VDERYDFVPLRLLLAVEQLTRRVGVARVTRGLLDEVQQRPAQIDRGVSSSTARGCHTPAWDDGAMEVHLDTDFGGDPDDACALAMLLGWPGVEVVGITTNLDDGGTRAGCVAHVLELAGRTDIPVVAGAETSDTTGERFASTWDDVRYWPTPIRPEPSPPERALELLQAGVERGATIVAIGAFTNLARLERARPGSLGDARVVAMAGWIDAPDPGLPQWGAAMDFNAQCDTAAVEVVAASAGLTLVPLPPAMGAPLRARDLPRLRAAGPVGALIARQSEVYGADGGMTDLGRAHAGLPDDLVNFHWDPLTAAVAVGWEGATVGARVLATVVDDGIVRFVEGVDGAGERATGVVLDIDGAAFRDVFLERVEAGARN